MSYDIWGIYRPKLSVEIWHGKTKHTLTGNVLQVTTHKATEEVMGQFAILLTYETHWERILSPMDYVELRFGRYSDSPPIIMRGFISNIRRTRTIGSDGKRIRTITINGNDYGKLLQQYQIYYAANDPGQQGQGQDHDPAQGLLVPQLFENFGAFGNGSNQTIALKDFIPTLINGSNGSTGLIAAWIKALKKTTPAIPDLKVSANVLSDYELLWLSLQPIQGSLADAINQYANLPWCEWFVYDTEEAPMIIHRNTPFKDSSGKYVFSESALSSAWTCEIYDYDVIEDDIGTSDNEVYDYFFTWPSNFSFGDAYYKYDSIGSQKLSSSQEDSSTFASNPKVNESAIYKYGMKIMEQASPAIPVIQTADSGTIDPMSTELSIKMNMWLYRAYGWGENQLNGTINIKGNENVRIGNYLFNKDSGEEYYIESVDHTFTVSQINSLGNDGSFSFTTSVGVTRGRYTSKPESGSESKIKIPTLSTSNSSSNGSGNTNSGSSSSGSTGGSFGGNGSGGGSLGPPAG